MTISSCVVRRRQSRVNPFAIDVPNRSACRTSPRTVQSCRFEIWKFVPSPTLLFLFRASSLLHERNPTPKTWTPAFLRLPFQVHWRDEWNMKDPWGRSRRCPAGTPGFSDRSQWRDPRSKVKNKVEETTASPSFLFFETTEASNLFRGTFSEVTFAKNEVAFIEYLSGWPT